MNSIEKEYQFIETLKNQLDRAEQQARLIHYDYCPVCYDVLGYEVTSDNKAILPKCKSCGWMGDWNRTLDEYEAKNYKRIKIIDRSLNETVQRS